MEKKEPENINQNTDKEQIDFDMLVDEAKHLKTEDGLSLVWKNVFLLPEWYFVPYGENNLPFMGTVEEKSWIFVFTDRDHAKEFSDEMCLIDTKGKFPLISIEIENVIDFLENFMESGVYGIRFNEGRHGWYASLKNLRAIRDYVTEF